MTAARYRREDFLLPDGSLDIDKLRAALDAENPSPEEMRAVADKYAKEYGKSMEDLLIEWIQSGELDESDMREAMAMIGTFPKSKFATGVQ